MDPTSCPICRQDGCMEREPKQVLDFSTTTPTLFDVFHCTSGKCGGTFVYRVAQKVEVKNAPVVPSDN